MKVVVFAQTPPPHHGQSYMVELMVRGLDDPRFGIEVFHVNAQFAADAEDIGRFRVGKVFQLFGYVLEALWFRFRHHAVTLYYIPTPPKRTPLFRDWAVLFALKPFFHHLVLHWHAAGLGEWIDKQPNSIKRITRMALARHDVSIVLGRFNKEDAEKFHPQQTIVVPNGIPDPCPNFADVLAGRQARLEKRLKVWNAPRPEAKATPEVVRVLFIGLCLREKGLFDAIEGVLQANALCAANQLALRFELQIAGSFVHATEEEEFRNLIAKPGIADVIRHVGFAAGDRKRALLADSDILCFPTFYSAESFGLVLVEAMAFGLPIVTTKWRSLPDVLPANYPGLVDIHSPDQISAALLLVAARDDAEDFRERFLENYTLDKFLENIARALKEADRP